MDNYISHFLPYAVSGRRGIVVACICPSLRPSVCPSVNFTFPHDNSSQVWAGITKFAPNMHPWILSVGIEMEVIDFDLWGHLFSPFWLRILGNLAFPHNNSSQRSSRSFWPFCHRILRNSACPRDNLSQIWTRINKFVPNMHPRIISTSHQILHQISMSAFY